MTATPVIAEDPPVLEARDGVFDARTTFPVATPAGIAQDVALVEDRRDQLGQTAIAAIGEHATMQLA